jgi:hypothetical protein
MSVNIDALAPFKEICRKICLNIPDSCSWQWDVKRGMAMVVLDEEDAEMVFFPLLKEFKHYRQFSSTSDEDHPLTAFIDSEYGFMPGQSFFTSQTLCDHVLSVAWWPWGSDNKVSMRVGLIPINQKTPENDFVFKCLDSWLNVAR